MAELTQEQQGQKDSAIAGDKAQIIDQAIAASTKLRIALGEVSNVLSAASARGYREGGEYEITDLDLLNKQFSAEEIHSVLGLFEELQKLSLGREVKQAPWGAINAKIAN